MTAVAAAAGKSRRTDVWRRTCDSRVRVEVSPSSRTTPSDVKQKTKTTPALDAIDVRSIGRVTVTNAVRGEAPRVRATVS